MVQGVVQPDQREGPVARGIEKQTSKIPSDWFLWGAVGAMAGALALQTMNSRHRALFVGQWVPTLLLFGVYNKIVKVAGSDRFDKSGNFDTNFQRGAFENE
jgi:hypothetical protein